MFKKSTVFIIVILVFSLFVFGCSDKEETVQGEKSTRSIVDMAGRTVEVPAEIEKVYSTGPIGTIFIYTLDPDKLVGWNSELNSSEEKYILKEYHDLPVLGTFHIKGNSANIEAILKTNPDVIISMGDVDQKYVSDAEEIQKQLGIPVLMVDGSLKNLSDSYIFMGELLGTQERAEELSLYCEQTIKETEKWVSQIPDEEKVRVFYAEGINGLETEPKGSLNSEVLDFVGAINVADTGLEKNLRRIQVSLEQVLNWNPDMIIVSSDSDSKHSVYNDIRSNNSWKGIKAVQSGNVYEIPCVPYDWINRPPSVNRMIGIKWLGNLLYPEYCELNIHDEVKKFFSIFYNFNLSNDEVEEILKRAKVNNSKI